MAVPPDVKFDIYPNEMVEYVAEEQKETEANWICEYCDTQNSFNANFCENCGSPKEEATRNYFDTAAPPTPPPPPVVTPAPPRKRRRRTSSSLGALMVILLIFAFIGSLFVPITRHTQIESFKWDRSIGIEVYNNYNEDDWYLPSGANLHYTNEEIHHYEQVLDHYETRTREVAREEFDGYDTEYRDLGNGQFEEIQTPRYRTVYDTEYYEEPVYRDEPVFQTKYYYDIDRWKKQYSVNTHGEDKNPEWGELPDDIVTDPHKLSHPEYGDEKEGQYEEHYYVNTVDSKGKSQTIEYSYNEWIGLEKGDGIAYKSYWWTDRPYDL